MKKIILFCLLVCNLFPQDNLPNYSVKLLNNQSSNLINLTRNKDFRGKIDDGSF